MDTVEASGKTVDDAILQALARLGRRRDEVNIEVLQEPSRGSFGLGMRDARVRVTVKPRRTTPSGAVITPELADALLGFDEAAPPVRAPQPPKPAVAQPQRGRPQPPVPQPPVEEDEEDEEFEDEEEFEDDEYDDEEEFEEDEEDEFEDDEEEGEVLIGVQSHLAATAVPEGYEETESEEEAGPASRELVSTAVEVLQTMLHHMNVPGSKVEVRSRDPLTLNVRMEDGLGLLIGRRGETLASLQLLVNLIVSHRIKHRQRIVLDVENYRMRREENLRQLAFRVAQQVRQSRRAIPLEAMPPNERRIVHMALSESPDVMTHSEGEGDQRRVIISLKRPMAR